MPQLSFRTSLFDALTVTDEDGAIVAIDWGFSRDQHATPLLAEARRQIEQYLDGERRGFDLPLRPHGSAYQQRVWQALRAIPYGATRTYTEVAAMAGGVARSVGSANGANPIPIVIPCHRVVASGSLGGYSGGPPDLGGPETKRRLLQLEERAA